MCYPECTLKEEHPCSDGWNVEQEEGLQPQEEVSDVGDEAVVAQEQGLVEEQVMEQEQGLQEEGEERRLHHHCRNEQEQEDRHHRWGHPAVPQVSQDQGMDYRRG